MNHLVAFFESIYYNITTNDHYAEFDTSDSQLFSEPSLPLSLTDTEMLFNQTRIDSHFPLFLALPQSPEPKLSWKRINRWLNNHCIELAAEVSGPATANDMRVFEADIGYRLPTDVRESFLVHNGQELSTTGTSIEGTRINLGLIFGSVLLSLEAVVTEWQVWCNTATLLEQKVKHYNTLSVLQKAVNSQEKFMMEWLSCQKSVPMGAVRCVYAHPQWLPLATDSLGNNIAVDLAPGPTGRWGQIILCGRDFDTKYVVAPSWAAFLERFADDLENGKHFVLSNEIFGVNSINANGSLENYGNEENALVFLAKNGRAQSYFDVLKNRVQQLYQTTNVKEVASEDNTKISLSSPYVVNPMCSQWAYRDVNILTNKTLSEVWSREPERAIESLY